MAIYPIKLSLYKSVQTNTVYELTPLLADKSPLFMGLRLLIVDHNLDAQEILTVMFELEGAEVITVSSASEALETLENYTPDLLISEVILPKEDGYSLISKIRSHKRKRVSQIPAIALTVAALNRERQQALLAGFNRHISKPFDLDELAATVATLWRNYALGRSNKTVVM